VSAPIKTAFDWDDLRIIDDGTPKTIPYVLSVPAGAEEEDPFVSYYSQI
jgi:hypothetical protein